MRAIVWMALFALAVGLCPAAMDAQSVESTESGIGQAPHHEHGEHGGCHHESDCCGVALQKGRRGASDPVVRSQGVPLSAGIEPATRCSGAMAVGPAPSATPGWFPPTRC